MEECPKCGKSDKVHFAEGGTEWSPQKYYACERCEFGFAVYPDGHTATMPQEWTREFLDSLKYAEGRD